MFKPGIHFYIESSVLDLNVQTQVLIRSQVPNPSNRIAVCITLNSKNIASALIREKLTNM